MSASLMRPIAALSLIASLALAMPVLAQEASEEAPEPQVLSRLMVDGVEHRFFSGGTFVSDDGIPVLALEVYYPYEDQSEAAVVGYADYLMDIELMDAAIEYEVTTVQLWLHDVAADGSMGEELADVQYDFDGAGQWTRVYPPDVPVQPSTFYTYEPVEEFTLPSGVTVYMEPLTTLYPGTDAAYPRVTAVIPEVAEDYSDAVGIAAELWDLALRDHEFLTGEREVNFRVVREHYQNTLYMRFGLNELLTREEADGTWPTLLELIAANRTAEEARAAEESATEVPAAE